MADQPGSHFKKETTQLCPDEEVNFENKIDPLNCSMVAIRNRTIKIEYSLQLTMADGNVCNALSDITSKKCYICIYSLQKLII